MKPLPENAAANTYREHRQARSMADVRGFLEWRRQGIASGVNPAARTMGRDMMGAACEVAFMGLAKKPVLTRKQAFEARQAKRQAAAA